MEHLTSTVRNNIFSQIPGEIGRSRRGFKEKRDTFAVHIKEVSENLSTG